MAHAPHSMSVRPFGQNSQACCSVLQLATPSGRRTYEPPLGWAGQLGRASSVSTSHTMTPSATTMRLQPSTVNALLLMLSSLHLLLLHALQGKATVLV